MKARTVVGRRGEDGPLCDPGSELLLGGRQGESSSARMINGMEKKRRKQNGVSEEAMPES